MATNNFNQVRIPLTLRRTGEGLPDLVERNLARLLSIEDAAAIQAALEKAAGEEIRMIELSEETRRKFWKRQFSLASSDADGSELAAQFLTENPVKSEYAASGRKAKSAARHRRHLALAAIVVEVGRFQSNLGDLLAATAAQMQAGLENLADACGIDFGTPDELAELRIQAGECRELGEKAAVPTTHRLGQQWGDLVNIARARLAIEPEAAAAPAKEKARRKIAEVDSQPVPETAEVADTEDGEGDDPQLALS